jgi:hypothetical protein
VYIVCATRYDESGRGRTATLVLSTLRLLSIRVHVDICICSSEGTLCFGHASGYRALGIILLFGSKARIAFLWRGAPCSYMARLGVDSCVDVYSLHFCSVRR